MTLNECAAFIRGMNRKEQEAWERTRMLMYAVVQVNSRDHLTPDALLPFPWDEDREPIEINMDEVNELRQRAKNLNMSDAIVRLLLNTQGFDGNLKNQRMR